LNINNKNNYNCHSPKIDILTVDSIVEDTIDVSFLDNSDKAVRILGIVSVIFESLYLSEVLKLRLRGRL